VEDGREDGGSVTGVQKQARVSERLLISGPGRQRSRSPARGGMRSSQIARCSPGSPSPSQSNLSKRRICPTVFHEICVITGVPYSNLHTHYIFRMLHSKVLYLAEEIHHSGMGDACEVPCRAPGPAAPRSAAQETTAGTQPTPTSYPPPVMPLHPGEQALRQSHTAQFWQRDRPAVPCRDTVGCERSGANAHEEQAIASQRPMSTLSQTCRGSGKPLWWNHCDGNGRGLQRHCVQPDMACGY
jgi:hypothetical protein